MEIIIILDRFMSKFKNNKDAMNKLYVTKNIIESLHSKINYFLPKKT